jgi:predicted RND superfamily exporter protein
MKRKPKASLFQRLAAFIVGKRAVFFLVYIVAIVFSLVSLGWVEIENDVTNYLRTHNYDENSL